MFEQVSERSNAWRSLLDHLRYVRRYSFSFNIKAGLAELDRGDREKAEMHFWLAARHVRECEWLHYSRLSRLLACFTTLYGEQGAYELWEREFNELIRREDLNGRYSLEVAEQLLKLAYLLPWSFLHIEARCALAVGALETRKRVFVSDHLSVADCWEAIDDLEPIYDKPAKLRHWFFPPKTSPREEARRILSILFLRKSPGRG